FRLIRARIEGDAVMALAEHARHGGETGAEHARQINPLRVERAYFVDLQLVAGALVGEDGAVVHEAVEDHRQAADAGARPDEIDMLARQLADDVIAVTVGADLAEIRG